MTAVRAFWKGRFIRRQNIAIAKKQQCGEFWVHTPEQFRHAIESAAFSVQRQEVCFRGYSDFIVALRGD